jgi:5-methyltetrahydrofolate--homocysteine methyltransferase
MADDSLPDRLAEGRIICADGAWGTYLQDMGLLPGTCPELWCLERPALVRGIAESYAAAGAEILGTNSFGANRFKLANFGLADRAGELNEAAVSLSREAAEATVRNGGPRPLVVASLGPTGKLLVAEEVSEDELYEAFAQQALGLQKGGADAVAVETMSDLEEARIAVRAIKETTGLGVVLSFTFERTVRGDYRTMMGVSPADVLRLGAEEGILALGANCGNGMERMAEVLGEFRTAAREKGMPLPPLLARANAGLPVLVEGRTVFPEGPEAMAALVPALIGAGARIVGGCCGTGPAHIAAFKRAIREA